MQLYTRTWGTGDRIALLVHGVMADHRTWWRVAPALVERGYQVRAVDLRGHGLSPRGEGAMPRDRYNPELFAQDLVDTLPTGADLALGHSLGGLSLRWAVDRLRPARVIYSEPAWTFVPPHSFEPDVFAGFKKSTREQIVARSPRWGPADVDVELATLACWDIETVFGLRDYFESPSLPGPPPVPSLVQLADDGFLVGYAGTEQLRDQGYEVRTVPGAGHTIHRDDFEGFFVSLKGWI